MCKAQSSLKSANVEKCYRIRIIVLNLSFGEVNCWLDGGKCCFMAPSVWGHKTLSPVSKLQIYLSK